MPQSPISCTTCPNRCDNPFERVAVSYLTRGGTQVYWTLRSSFMEPQPYTFQLQVGTTGNQEADDWVNVGGPVMDQFTAVDGEQRVHGVMRWQFYRVLLQTPDGGIYASAATGIDGTLPKRDWRIARDLVRQAKLRLKSFAGQQGYLLKRRVTGEPCPRCLDFQTREVKDPLCPVCYGTGYRCGYYFPMDCVWAEIDPKVYHLAVQGTRGTVTDVGIKATMTETWLLMLTEGDVWINKLTDDRYYVHAVRHLAEIRGIPLVADVELRLAPYSDPIYSVDIPNQLQDLERLKLGI